MPARKTIKQSSSRRARSASLASGKTKIFNEFGLDPQQFLQDAEPRHREPFTKAEKKKFREFQKDALKVGLLVTRNSYELYFRDRLRNELPPGK